MKQSQPGSAPLPRAARFYREVIKLVWPQGAPAVSIRRHEGLENSGCCVAATLRFTPGLVETPSHSTRDPLSRPGLSWSSHQEL